MKIAPVAKCKMSLGLNRYSVFNARHGTQYFRTVISVGAYVLTPLK